MSTPLVAPRTSKPLRVPPLQSGDRLTAEEFERRFDATPGLLRAELIDGVVYMPPPVSDEFHSEPQFDVVTWLGLYRVATPGIAGSDNGTLRLDPKNRPQPDAALRVLPEFGGRVTRDADGYLVAAPEFIFEVSGSTASYDLNVKFELYRRHGVREYVVWRVYEAAIDWFVLRDGAYVPLAPGADGVFRSEVLPGLWLDAAALIGGDLPAVMRVQQQGLASSEHAGFVARLSASRQPGQ
jgi:Uma2 family endonuclease